MYSIDALTFLSSGDFFVGVKKSSEKATETLYQTLSLSVKAIENLVKGDMMWPDGEVKLLSDQVLGSVDMTGVLFTPPVGCSRLPSAVNDLATTIF